MSSLPLILISAKSKDDASFMMSEIVDNVPEDMDIGAEEGRVWRISNKYYTADVLLRPAAGDGPPPAAGDAAPPPAVGDEPPPAAGDAAPPPAAGDEPPPPAGDAAPPPVVGEAATPPAGAEPEGHVIYLPEDECSASAAERLRGAGRGAAVCVLVCGGAGVPAELRAWAARRRYAPVPLLEAGGPAAVRAALQAHVWPGLARRREEGGGGAGAGELAEALGSLRGAAAAVRALPAQGGERRAAAEAVLERFARALRLDLDDL